MPNQDGVLNVSDLMSLIPCLDPIPKVVKNAEGRTVLSKVRNKKPIGEMVARKGTSQHSKTGAAVQVGGRSIKESERKNVHQLWW